MKTLAERIRVLYRIQDRTHSEYGALAWFRREFDVRGYGDIPAQTFYRWCHNGVPDHMVKYIEYVFADLADEAQQYVDSLTREIEEVR